MEAMIIFISFVLGIHILIALGESNKSKLLDLRVRRIETKLKSKNREKINERV